MSVLAPFILNAVLNFVLGLLVARELGPASFGRYAIAASVMVLVNALILDWLRMSVMRFYTRDSRETEPAVRATLDRILGILSLALALVAVLTLGFDIDLGLGSQLIAAALVAGIASGLFDFHTAIARARFLDGVYALLIVVKNALAILLMVGAAWWTRDPVWVLLGLVISVVISLALVRTRLTDPKAAPEWPLARQFAAYAFPVVWANVIYSAIPLILRVALAAEHGYAEAGYFSLAADIGIKILGAVVTALEIILLRQLVEMEREQGLAAAELQASRNLVIIAAIMLPLGAGWWLLLPSFEALLVPQSFHGPFRAYMAALVPAMLALGVAIAGFNSLFLLRKDTIRTTVSALTGLAVMATLLFVLPRLMGPIGYAWVQTAAFVAVMLTMMVLAQSRLHWQPIRRDLLLVVAATLAMSAALWPLTGRLRPILELPVLGLAGMILFGGLMLAFNIGDLRGLIRARR